LPRSLKRQALLAIERAFNRASARIVAPSTYIVELLTRRQGVDPGKIDHVPYGFVPQKYTAIDESQRQRLHDELGLAGRFVLGTFARLHEEKGHRYLIEAVRQLRTKIPELLVLLVGDGPERERIEAQIDSAGLNDAVRLLGWRRDPLELMAVVEAVVQPTLQEAFSQSMVEALWMGKPLVITDVSGATDTVTDGMNGLRVPKADPAALAHAISRLAGDSSLRRRLGAAGKAYVEQNLTIDKIIPRYEQVYLRTLAA
jgi:glycosyltransferase involved in cell wall biosynthesis